MAGTELDRKHDLTNDALGELHALIRNASARFPEGELDPSEDIFMIDLDDESDTLS